MNSKLKTKLLKPKPLNRFVAFIFLLFLFSFAADNSLTTPTELGNKLFEVIKAQKKDDFLDLMVKKKEIISTINKSDMPQDKAEAFKKIMREK